MPIRTYWPGTWPAQSLPGRITIVAASAVSGWTSTIRPRRSAPRRSGVEHVEDVGGHQRGDRGFGQAAQAVAEGDGGPAQARFGREEMLMTPCCPPGSKFMTRQRESTSLLFGANNNVPSPLPGAPPATRLHLTPETIEEMRSRSRRWPSRRSRRSSTRSRATPARSPGRWARTSGPPCSSRSAGSSRWRRAAAAPTPDPGRAGGRGRLPARPRRGPQRPIRRRAARGVPDRRPGLLARDVGHRGAQRGRRRHPGQLRRAGLRLHRRAVGGERGRAHRRARHHRPGPPAAAGAAGAPPAPAARRRRPCSPPPSGRAGSRRRR